jgi:hypothetical protein
VELREREAVIRRRTGASVQDLDEGVRVVTQEYAGDDGVGLCALGVDQLEVPALEAGPTASDHVVKVEALGSPDGPKTCEDDLPSWMAR